MQRLSFNHLQFKDARNWQLVFLSTFLLFGIWQLGWADEMRNFIYIAPTALLVQLIAIKAYRIPIDSIKSALITSFGLTLLLKSDDPKSLFLAAALAIGSKFLIRYKGKHFFNPANFGIVAAIVLLQHSWVSPGQWGSSTLLLLMIGSAGIMVLQKANRIDTGLTFLGGLFLLDASRIILYQGWEWDVLLHKYMSGSLLLFSFFMITDPAATPNHRTARTIWALGVALLTFYLQSFVQLHTAPIWALFAISPVTPLFDRIFKAERFTWITERTVKTGTSIALVFLIFFQTFTIQPAKAFCGFYVAKADAKLFNKSSQVILVRDGEKSVITMNSDFEGNVKDFAMVVPVPSILKKEQIRIANASLFKVLDEYSGPRLVEYFDENPCYPRMYEELLSKQSVVLSTSTLDSKDKLSKRNKVKIEARYTVGEYDILILSAKESTGLKSWLIENGYKIPADAEAVLEPYIKSNMKFFVVKVNLEEQRKLGFETLRPIQITFNSPKFMLPIRLGMANAKSDQDMIVYAFSKKGRIECTNYRTIKIPTDKNVPLDVESKFGEFYKSLFNKVWARQKDAVYLEYAWNVTPGWGGMKCDPCVGPPPLTADLTDAGVDWSNRGMGDQVYFTRMHVRYGRAYFPQDLQFQETPNRENFQGRYILTHPAEGDLSCSSGQQYLIELIKKRQREVQNLAALTGWKTQSYQAYLNEYTHLIRDQEMKKNLIPPVIPDDQDNSFPGSSTITEKIGFSIAILMLVILSIWSTRRKQVSLKV